MIVHIKVRQVVASILQHHKYLIFTIELAKILSLTIIIKSLDITIEPNLATTQWTATMTLQCDLADLNLGKHITSSSSTFDGNLAKIFIEEDLLQLWIRLEGNLNDLSFAIRISREIKHPRTCCTLCKVIFPIADYRSNIEALDEADTSLSITIYGIVNGTLIILAENGDMDDFNLLLVFFATLCLADKEFVCNANNLVGAVSVEDDNIVDIRAVRDKLILLKRSANEAFFPVDIKLLVSLYHFCSRNCVEVTNLCQTGMLLAILLFDEAEPITGHLNHILQFAVNLPYLTLDGSDVLRSLVLVELQDASHLDIHQFQDVVLRHLTNHLRIVWCQALINPFTSGIHRFCTLKFLVLVDTLFNEDLFEVGEVKALHEFTTTNETLLTKKSQCVVNT